MLILGAERKSKTSEENKKESQFSEVFEKESEILENESKSSEEMKTKLKTEKMTFDCWKQILHDESPEPSQGKYLKDILSDSRLKKV
jgi:hypothetical protein